MLNHAQIEDNWERLGMIIDDVLNDPLRNRYLEMLETLRADQSFAGTVVLGFMRSPGSRNIHHAYAGGLVAHLLEMWDAWTHIRQIVPRPAHAQEHLSDARILRAIINHDAHKGYGRYVLVSEDPWAVDFNKEDQREQLMGSDVNSLQLLMTHRIPMDPLQVNALLNAEGGFADVKTDWVSTLSKMVYILDEFSASVISRVQSDRLLNARRNG